VANVLPAPFSPRAHAGSGRASARCARATKPRVGAGAKREVRALFWVFIVSLTTWCHAGVEFHVEPLFPLLPVHTSGRVLVYVKKAVPNAEPFQVIAHPD